MRFLSFSLLDSTVIGGIALNCGTRVSKNRKSVTDCLDELIQILIAPKDKGCSWNLRFVLIALENKSWYQAYHFIFIILFVPHNSLMR